MQHLHAEVDVPAGHVVVVELDQAANVLLLDTGGYSCYQNGQSFRYYGGLAKVSPVILRPPYPGHWHVVIDLGGGGGLIRHSISIQRSR